MAVHGEALRHGTLRTCVSAGEALNAATRALWKEATGIEIIDGIGSTEMLHIFISHDEDHARPGATGKAVPGYRARVVDDQGREVPPGTVGRLAVQGPTGCRSLSDERQKTYVQGGWNLTGDAYLMDADGYFHYQARTDTEATRQLLLAGPSDLAWAVRLDESGYRMTIDAKSAKQGRSVS